MSYTPPNTTTLETKKFSQIRLGIQGYPKTGKTTSALTFPKPIVLDFDNNVDAANAVAAGKSLDEITLVPFYSPAFVDTLVPKRTFAGAAPNRRDALTKWLREHAFKLEPDQTLVLDSWTMVQNAFDQQTGYEPAVSRTGAEDKFVFWKRKIEYAQELCEILKSINCHVVVTFHETIERDDEGRPTGKLRPAMQGQFADQLAGNFTNWFRQQALSRHKDPNNTKSEVIGTDYVWQTSADNIANCGTKLIGIRRIVPAKYDVFVHPENYK